ncbi:MAG: inositol monophosphatase family protein [Nanoarchaeota archaeon]
MSRKVLATSVALEAGKLLMKHYRKNHNLEWNTRNNFSIEVDKLSDELIYKSIKKYFPGESIYSEERESKLADSGLQWIVDPLDGTIPYTLGINDNFGVCIALVENREPILGVVYAPKRDELYVAEKGWGAYCNGEKIQVSLENNINHVIADSGAGKNSKDSEREKFASIYRVLCSSEGIACIVAHGCASIPLCLTASGRIQAFLAMGLEPEDMAAAAIINKEAGAKVTPLFEDREWRADDKNIFAANYALHENTTSLLRKRLIL